MSVILSELINQGERNSFEIYLRVTDATGVTGNRKYLNYY